MLKFSLGVLAGAAVGAGLILSVHPMSKRDMKKACHRTEKMMKRAKCRLMSCNMGNLF